MRRLGRKARPRFLRDPEDQLQSGLRRQLLNSAEDVLDRIVIEIPLAKGGGIPVVKELVRGPQLYVDAVLPSSSL